MKKNAIKYRNGIREGICTYPRMDMGEIVGLTDGIEYKLIIDTDKPPYDPMIETVVKEEIPTDDPHPTYPHLKKVLYNYTVERLSDNEIIQHIYTHQKDANQSIIDAGGQSEELQYLTMYALIRLAKGQSVPPQAMVVSDAVEVIALGIVANGQNAELLIEQVNLGLDPDINNGWTYG